MLRVIIVLVLTSESLAYYYGDLRIVGGGSSGQLQFDTGSNNWGAICKTGFDDDAGNVACKQLGYARSSDVYTYSHYSYDGSVVICDTICLGSEDELTECYLDDCTYSTCLSGVVGITCTNSLSARESAGEIAGIVIGTLAFIGIIATIVTLCICCLSPTCPCYYRRSHTTSTVIVTGQQAIPQVITTTTTKANTTNYPGPPPAPCYYPSTGYQPYPVVPPAAATVKY